MATKKAKTALKAGESGSAKRACPECGAETKVVRYEGFGPRGMFWVCEKECGYMQRTH